MLICPIVSSLNGFCKILSADMILDIGLDIFAERAVNLSVTCFKDVEIFACN